MAHRQSLQSLGEKDVEFESQTFEDLASLHHSSQASHQSSIGLSQNTRMAADNELNSDDDIEDFDDVW